MGLKRALTFPIASIKWSSGHQLNTAVHSILPIHFCFLYIYWRESSARAYLPQIVQTVEIDETKCFRVFRNSIRFRCAPFLFMGSFGATQLKHNFAFRRMSRSYWQIYCWSLPSRVRKQPSAPNRARTYPPHSHITWSMMDICALGSNVAGRMEQMDRWGMGGSLNRSCAGWTANDRSNGNRCCTLPCGR